ncbi:MAG: hypothetical protein QHH14_08150 [Clostridiales bacterium]|nr:hypothetical protein [Clostridiales bacterium]
MLYPILKAAALLLASALFFSPLPLSSQVFDFHGLVSGWATVSGEKGTPFQAGLRWLPAFSLVKTLRGESLLDAELSVNARGSVNIHSSDDIRTDGKIRLYRGQARFSSPRFEARLGLQKISFGSAAFLRPLMWFDRLDPRDPLQITDGVYGLLLRYYFLNNANVWLWGLYGNEDPKGWEFLPTATKRPELGGRIQTPLGKGELALSYHHRRATVAERELLSPPPQLSSSFASSNSTAIPENRYALDGKWDFGVGVWFEAVVIRQHNERLPYARQRSFVIGVDYTFGLGNGLHVLWEYFEYTSGANTWSGGQQARFLAVSLAHPIGILDNLTGILYYDRENRDVYTFFRWQRTYDRWNFHLMAFWNPKRFQIYGTEAGANMFAGKGIQVMAVFHY